MVVPPRSHLIDSLHVICPLPPRLPRLPAKNPTSPRKTTVGTTRKSIIHTIMDPTGDPEDLRTFPNPSTLVSRPGSSGSELSELSDWPSESGAAKAGRTSNYSTMAHTFGDMGELAAVGLVAQAVNQEVLEQEVAVKVPFPSPALIENVNNTNSLDRQKKLS